MLLRVLKKLCNYFIPSRTPENNTEPAGVVPHAATVINAYVGNLTHYQGDAIVNAANSQLMAGGGVCGHIFKAAGHDALQDACDAIGHCATGDACITPGFDLDAKFVIHAVGPIYEEGRNNAELLAGAYTSSLREALAAGVRSIGFPAISTGIYGYPLEDATVVAVAAVREFCAANPGIDRVDFVCFSPEVYAVYEKTLHGLTTYQAPSPAP